MIGPSYVLDRLLKSTPKAAASDVKIDGTGVIILGGVDGFISFLWGITS